MNTVQEFYDYFAAIPEELWTQGDLITSENEKCRCALGHLGVKKYCYKGQYHENSVFQGFNIEEVENNVKALGKLFGDDYATLGVSEHCIFRVNDNRSAPPKSNILDKLIRLGAHANS